MQTVAEYQVEAAGPSDHASFGIPEASDMDLYNILLSLTVHSLSEDRPEDLHWFGKHCYVPCIRRFLGPTSSSQQDIDVQQAPLTCYMLGQLLQVPQDLSNAVSSRPMSACWSVCVSVSVSCGGLKTFEFGQRHALLLKCTSRLLCLLRL